MLVIINIRIERTGAEWIGEDSGGMERTGMVKCLLEAKNKV